MEGPLDGIRIVDLTTMISGPFATMQLADQGADVVKVEPPSGDEMRRVGPPVNGIPALFFSCNRNKRSLCIDLRREEGVEALRAVVKTADVFVQNFRPGAIERMGFGEPEVRALAPDIVYVSITGFGEKGPHADQRVYDPVVQALSTATEIQADPETRRPRMHPIVLADKISALTAAQAITSALFVRERAGVGQHVKLSMLEAVLGLLWPQGMVGLTYEDMEFDVTKVMAPRDDIYATRDGYVTLTTVSDAEWRGLCRALDKPEWIDDARFATYNARLRTAAERAEMVAEAATRFETSALVERLAGHGVPCAATVARMELLTHPQITANDTIETHAFPGFGNVRQVRPPATFERTPSAIRSPAPQLGEHSEAVLEAAGLAPEGIRRLVAEGVIVSGPTC